MWQNVKPMIVNHLTRSELIKCVKEDYIAILTLGSCEQHGPHLPMGTDILLAEYLANEITKKTKAVIFPSINYGYSWVWKDFQCGTVTLSQDEFKNHVFEVVESIAKMGFKTILLVNGHDSNKQTIKYVLRDLSERYESRILNIFYPKLTKIYEKYMESKTWSEGMFHADEFETSLMLALNENYVHMDLAVEDYPERPKLYGYDHSTLSNLSSSGVFGDPTKASKLKGEKMMSEFVSNIIELLI